MHLRHKFLYLFSISFMPRISLTTMMLASHFKCRGGYYPRSKIERFAVSDDKVSWTSNFPEYNPPNYTSPHIEGKPWADPDIGAGNFTPLWNKEDGNLNRVSHMGAYDIVDSYPLNPIGRTGIKGRGVLGRWGPNHAADPVVSRRKTIDNKKVIHEKTKKHMLQIVVIKRGDTGTWALPGGMVDPGETTMAASIREFREEATNSLESSAKEKQLWQSFEKFFSEGIEIYKGYVDDGRNTDNAWIETVAYNFHDETGATVDHLALKAGDDAIGVQWLEVDSGIKLHASHKKIVQIVVEKLNAHW